MNCCNSHLLFLDRANGMIIYASIDTWDLHEPVFMGSACFQHGPIPGPSVYQSCVVDPAPFQPVPSFFEPGAARSGPLKLWFIKTLVTLQPTCIGPILSGIVSMSMFQWRNFMRSTTTGRWTYGYVAKFESSRSLILRLLINRRSNSM
jgi:hypothetical protein